MDLPVRMPPHSLEHEEGALGCPLAIAFDGGDAAPLLVRLAARVQITDLYFDAHRTIYGEMLALHEAGRAVAPLTLLDALREAGALAYVGGAEKVVTLTEHGVIPSLLDESVRIILRDAARRVAIQELTAAVSDQFDDGAEPVAIIARVTERLGAVAERLTEPGETKATGPRPLAEVVDAYVASLETPETDFVTFGVAGVDERLGGGALRGEVVLLGGPHSAGKTALAIQVATMNARLHGHRVLVISREMTSIALVRRLIAQDARINAKALRRRDLDPFDRGTLAQALPRMRALPIWFDDATSTITGIRRLVRAGGYRLVVIDYLQLLDPPSSARGNRRLEVTEISRAIKKLAGRERCTILALSSLSRLPYEKGKTKAAPQTSNLKESGDLEYDADVVMLVHWPDTTQSERQIHLGKVRDGETGGAPITIDYEPAWVRFVMPEPMPPTPPRQTALREPGEDDPPW